MINVKQSETRINPLTNQQNPGYWELKTGYITSDNFKTIEDLLFDRIRSKIDKIKEVLSKGNGEALFWIVPSVRNKEFPDVSISREFIQIAAQLMHELISTCICRNNEGRNNLFRPSLLLKAWTIGKTLYWDR